MLDRMRDVIMAAVLGAAALLSGRAHAGLANLTPPPSWTAAAAGQTERGMFRAAAANAETWLSATVRTTATLNVGGELATMPAGFRMAANAGRFATRFAWGNPILFAAGAIAVPLLLDWLQQQKFFWNDSTKRWEQEVEGRECLSGCYEYAVLSVSNTRYLSPEEACNAAGALMWGGYGTVNGAGDFCYTYKPNGQYGNGWGISRWSIPPYNTAFRQPIDQATMEEATASHALPDDVANEIAAKGGALPVGDPIINPSPLPDFAPTPLVIPQGLPQPIPGTDPQQYKQPQLKVSPAPVPGNPWQVDVTPQDETNTDPTKLTLDPKSVPNTGTSTSTITPKDQTQLDLCQLHPEILACQKLGEAPDADPLTTKTVNVEITPYEDWALTSATCPAPRTVPLATWGGRSVEFSMQPLCDFASGVRPVVIGVAYLTAIFLFFNIGRKSS